MLHGALSSTLFMGSLKGGAHTVTQSMARAEAHYRDELPIPIFLRMCLKRGSLVVQDYRDELATPECKAQVHKLSERAAQDIRFDEPLADACYEDRNKLCDGVQPVIALHLKSTLSNAPLPHTALHVSAHTCCCWLTTLQTQHSFHASSACSSVLCSGSGGTADILTCLAAYMGNISQHAGHSDATGLGSSYRRGLNATPWERALRTEKLC